MRERGARKRPTDPGQRQCTAPGAGPCTARVAAGTAQHGRAGEALTRPAKAPALVTTFPAHAGMARRQASIRCGRRWSRKRVGHKPRCGIGEPISSPHPWGCMATATGTGSQSPTPWQPTDGSSSMRGTPLLGTRFWRSKHKRASGSRTASLPVIRKTPTTLDPTTLPTTDQAERRQPGPAAWLATRATSLGKIDHPPNVSVRSAWWACQGPAAVRSDHGAGSRLAGHHSAQMIRRPWSVLPCRLAHK